MSANPFGVRGQHAPAEFAEWTGRIRRARQAYYHQQDLEAERTIPCECGASFSRPWRLAAHKRQGCPLGAS